MRPFQRKTEIVILSLCGLLASAPAHAYLDPGTGMAVIQGIIAAIAGAIVVVKLYWYRLLRLLGIRKSERRTGKGAPDK